MVEILRILAVANPAFFILGTVTIFVCLVWLYDRSLTHRERMKQYSLPNEVQIAMMASDCQCEECQNNRRKTEKPSDN